MQSIHRHRSVRLLAPSSALLIVLLLATTASAQLHLENTLSTSPPQINGFLGTDVDLQGDLLAVGSSGTAGFQGAVYFFERQGTDWVAAGVLLHDQPGPSNQGFGTEVQLDGDTLAVASFQSISVFRSMGGQWVREVDLALDSDGGGASASVALSGDTLAISTFDAVEDHVLVYVRSGGVWSLEQDIEPTPNGQTAIITDADTTIALDGDALIIGRLDSSPFPGGTTSFSWLEAWDRAAGVWSRSQTIQANVGSSISLRGDRFVASGAYVSYTFGFPADVTYYNQVYNRVLGTWFKSVDLPVFADGLGHQVALGDDELIVIRNWIESGNFYPQVDHYVLNGTVWNQTSSVLFPTVHDTSALAVLSDGHLVVGHRSSDMFADSAGAVSVLRTSPWGLIEAGALAGTGGVAPQFVGTGPLTPDSSNFLQLSGALPNSACHLVAGLGLLLHSPFKGGVFVPTPDVLILGLPVDGSGNNQVLLTWWPSSVPAGTKVYVQQWVSDPMGPVGFAASNGLEMVGQ